MKNKTKHGMYGTPTYFVWASMKRRCSSPKAKGYERYGGRGLVVCEYWQSFVNFFADIGERPSKKHSIERTDNNRGYSCGHCKDCKRRGETRNGKWATAIEQGSNKRSNRLLTHDGKTQTMAEWARQIGIGSAALLRRLKTWSQEDALSKPKTVDFHGKIGPKGERSGHARLTELDVIEIRKLLKFGKKEREIADIYGVARTTIADINHRRTWGHI